MKITGKELRQKWLDFYKARGHADIGAVSLPFMFLFGAEKGRLIAPVVLGFSATLLVSFELSRIGGAEGFVDLGAALGLAGIAAALYAVSWLVSVIIVQKRDF